MSQFGPPSPGPATYQPEPYQPAPPPPSGYGAPVGPPPAAATWSAYGPPGRRPRGPRLRVRWLAAAVVVLAAAGFFGYRLTRSDSPAGAPVVPGAGEGTTTSAAPANSPEALGRTLEAIALQPADFTNGYTIRLLPRGAEVRGQVTLDLCGYHFTTEAHRVARREYVVRDPSGHMSLQNEVVAYDTPASAVRALAEWHRAAAHCPTGVVHSAVAGTPPMHEHILRNAVYVAGLPVSSNAFTEVSATLPVGPRAYGIAALQVRGRYLDAVYATQLRRPTAGDVRATALVATITGRRLVAAA